MVKKKVHGVRGSDLNFNFMSHPVCDLGQVFSAVVSTLALQCDSSVQNCVTLK